MITLVPDDVCALSLILGQLYSYIHCTQPQWCAPSEWDNRVSFIIRWKRSILIPSDSECFRCFYSFHRCPSKAPAIAFAFLMKRAQEEGVSLMLQQRLEEVYNSHSRLILTSRKARKDLFYTQLIESSEAISSLAEDMHAEEIRFEMQTDETLEDLETASNILSPENKSTYDSETSFPPYPNATLPQSSFGLVLRGFLCVNRKKMAKKIKKEYFRTQHIRALKKSIRQIVKEKEPASSIHRLKINENGQTKIWQKLKHFYCEHSSFLFEASQVDNEPLSRSKSLPVQSPFKSFNNAYCKSFFSSSITQNYNLIFCDLVYDHESPHELCQKMRIFCCLKDKHSSGCQDKWRDLKRYAQIEMLEEVGLSVKQEWGDAAEADFYLAEPEEARLREIAGNY